MLGRDRIVAANCCGLCDAPRPQAAAVEDTRYADGSIACGAEKARERRREKERERDLVGRDFRRRERARER